MLNNGFGTESFERPDRDTMTVCQLDDSLRRHKISNESPTFTGELVVSVVNIPVNDIIETNACQWSAVCITFVY
jgi:hypothetical protein